MAGQFIAKRLKLEETLTQRFGFGGASYKNLIPRPITIGFPPINQITNLPRTMNNKSFF
jgi:hypothetical protein